VLGAACGAALRIEAQLREQIRLILSLKSRQPFPEAQPDEVGADQGLPLAGIRGSFLTQPSEMEDGYPQSGTLAESAVGRLD